MIEYIMTELKDFISANYQNYLDVLDTVEYPLVAPTDILEDYPDFDRYNANTVMYILPDSFSFETLDVGSDIELTVRANIYLFVRNNKTDVLIKQSLRFLKAFVEMIKENQQLGGKIIDSTLIDGDTFLDVEGNTNIKGFKINIDLINII